MAVELVQLPNNYFLVCAGGEQSVENLFVLQSFVLQQLYLNVRKKKKVFHRL